MKDIPVGTTIYSLHSHDEFVVNKNSRQCIEYRGGGVSGQVHLSNFDDYFYLKINGKPSAFREQPPSGAHKRPPVEVYLVNYNGPDGAQLVSAWFDKNAAIRARDGAEASKAPSLSGFFSVDTVKTQDGPKV